MTELERVSFRKPREHKPRLSKPRVPGNNSIVHWTAAEIAIMRQHFPLGGVPACQEHLPAHRSPGAISQRGHQLGLKAPFGTSTGKAKGARVERILPPDGFADALREFYQSEASTARGAVNAFADRLKLPRWWVSKQARAAGLSMPHKKEPPWTAPELALLERVPLHNTERCSEVFRQHGFSRSPMSIRVKSTRVGLSRAYTETFSATAVSKILGVDGKTVTREILQGDLRAVKRPTERLPQQGGDPWSIDRSELRRYIIENLGRVDFRKIDKFAAVDILVNAEPPARTIAPELAKPDGRKTSWTPERRAAQAERMRQRLNPPKRKKAA